MIFIIYAEYFKYVYFQKWQNHRAILGTYLPIVEVTLAQLDKSRWCLAEIRKNSWGLA